MEDEIKERKSGVNQLAFGSIVFVWGILLVLRQVGVITVSTLPFVFTAFGALLVISGVVKLSRSRNIEQSIKAE
jgi:uncharacterized membrane protein